jgi:hypothetical protein
MRLENNTELHYYEHVKITSQIFSLVLYPSFSTSELP